METILETRVNDMFMKDSRLSEEFVSLLEPGGKLDFVIPLIQERSRMYFSPTLSVEFTDASQIRIGFVKTRPQWLCLRLEGRRLFLRMIRDFPRLQSRQVFFLDSPSEIARLRKQLHRILKRSALIEKWINNLEEFQVTAKPGGWKQILEPLYFQSPDPWQLVHYDPYCWHCFALTRHAQVLLLYPHASTNWLAVKSFCAREEMYDEKFKKSVLEYFPAIARQKLRLGLLPNTAASIVNQEFVAVEFGIILRDANPRDPKRLELSDWFQEEGVSPPRLYTWMEHWNPTVRELPAICPFRPKPAPLPQVN